MEPLVLSFALPATGSEIDESLLLKKCSYINGAAVTSAQCLLLKESWIERRNNTQSIPTVRS